MVCWQGINACICSPVKFTQIHGIFNPYCQRDKSNLGNRKATSVTRQKHKQLYTRRATSALLIPVFCFIHNHLFLISSEEQGLSLSINSVQWVATEAGACQKPHALTVACSQEPALGDGWLSSRQKGGSHSPLSETLYCPHLRAEWTQTEPHLAFSGGYWAQLPTFGAPRGLPHSKQRWQPGSAQMSSSWTGTWTLCRREGHRHQLAELLHQVRPLLKPVYSKRLLQMNTRCYPTLPPEAQSLSQQRNPNCAPHSLLPLSCFSSGSISCQAWLFNTSKHLHLDPWGLHVSALSPSCHPSSPGDQVLAASCQLGQGGHKDTDGAGCIAGDGGQWSELDDFKEHNL